MDPRGLDYHWLRLGRSPRPDLQDSETRAIDGDRVSVTLAAMRSSIG